MEKVLFLQAPFHCEYENVDGNIHSVSGGLNVSYGFSYTEGLMVIARKMN
jgi:hypothetical protein